MSTNAEPASGSLHDRSTRWPARPGGDNSSRIRVLQGSGGAWLPAAVNDETYLLTGIPLTIGFQLHTPARQKTVATRSDANAGHLDQRRGRSRVSEDLRVR